VRRGNPKKRGRGTFYEEDRGREGEDVLMTQRDWGRVQKDDSKLGGKPNVEGKKKACS